MHALYRGDFLWYDAIIIKAEEDGTSYTVRFDGYVETSITDQLVQWDDPTWGELNNENYDVENDDADENENVYIPTEKDHQSMLAEMMRKLSTNSSSSVPLPQPPQPPVEDHLNERIMERPSVPRGRRRRKRGKTPAKK